MIQIKNLTKRYGEITAIKNLNFSVNKGEIVGFLGPNGAGKSTTMKIITGYMAPSSGEVSVGGFDVFESPLEVKKKIGYLPETPPLYTDMLVKDYLKFVAKLKGVPNKEVKKMVDSSIEKTNLGDVRNRLINNLSKGFKQRVGLAQALVSDPEILILDEPTVGLDPKQVMEIRNLIKSLSGEHTVILSTHILPEVQSNCERIIIINKGSIVAEDTLDGLNRRLSGAHRLIVRTRKQGSEVIESIKGVRGVIDVESLNGNGSYQVDVEDQESTAEAIAEAVVNSGVGLMELRKQDMSLEEVFIKVTGGDQ